VSHQYRSEFVAVEIECIIYYIYYIYYIFAFSLSSLIDLTDNEEFFFAESLDHFPCMDTVEFIA